MGEYYLLQTLSLPHSLSLSLSLSFSLSLFLPVNIPALSFRTNDTIHYLFRKKVPNEHTHNLPPPEFDFMELFEMCKNFTVSKKNLIDLFENKSFFLG